MIVPNDPIADAMAARALCPKYCSYCGKELDFEVTYSGKKIKITDDECGCFRSRVMAKLKTWRRKWTPIN